MKVRLVCTPEAWAELGLVAAHGVTVAKREDGEEGYCLTIDPEAYKGIVEAVGQKGKIFILE